MPVIPLVILDMDSKTGSQSIIRLQRENPMQKPILVPDLQTGIERLVLSAWLIEEGDFVDVGDQVAEIRIPGVTFDVLAEFSGRLVRIEKSADVSIAAGDVMGWIDGLTS